MHPVQTLLLTQIKPNPRNARTHSKKQIAQIAASIQAFGYTVPVLVNEDYVLLAGHGRVEAARLLGLDKVPAIVRTGLSAAQQRALMLADNKIAANAGGDRERLAAEIPELADLLILEDLDISLTGFDPAEIDALLADFDEGGDPDDDLDPDLLKGPPVSRSGDLWRLEHHRLLCGDARSETDLDLLMDGGQASMAFLDPPYNVDIVTVYKVDRLTRSLSDFAKLVDLFDAHKVTFVSVTQSFNTTTNMGRLNLNMLLSFAQFEREVTGERIRDKIAASKRKGIWVGGVVPLGYPAEDRKLLIDPEEAEIVRLIFQRYLELHSLPALQCDLRERGIVTRKRALATGRISGGVPLTNGPLRYLLRNRLYLGEINHMGSSYPGEHEAIIPNELFDKVQAQLDENLNGHRRKREQSIALLLELSFDDRGNRMSPTNSQKKGAIRYRYYTSCVTTQGRKDEAGSISRVSAPAIEAIVIDALRAREFANADDRTLIRDSVARVDILPDKLLVKQMDGDLFSLSWLKPAQVRRREIIGTDGSQIVRPMKAEARVVLLRSIAQGRRWLDEIVEGRSDSLEAIATREGCSRRHVERTVANAFLAPQIVKAACEGRLPRGANSKALADAPAEWSAQLKMLGITPAG